MLIDIEQVDALHARKRIQREQQPKLNNVIN